MTDARRDRCEHEIATALAEVQVRRTRGESPDALAFRERLGASHAEFMEILEVESMLDDLIEPPLPERLPRDFGAYKLIRQLGKGAIGVVYEAVHRTLHRKAAVKVLRSGFDSDPQARERFRREAYATAQVRHDHVVEIFEAGEVDGSPFYAMSLVDGRSLASLVKARQAPPVRDLCRELAGIADALDALHRAGIVHRDVKPSNIMVRPDGRMILADFGLARAEDGLALTRSGDAVGTPLYMPPEQLLGRRDEIDARADVYALGATLYEAVAGRPAHSATAMAELAKSKHMRSAHTLRQASGCPSEVDHIAMKAIEPKREDRYATAAAMRDDLKAFGEGRPQDVVGKPVGAILRTIRWGRSPAGLSIAAGTLVAIGAAFWWTHRPATLDLSSLPAGADVLVGKESWGKTPFHRELEPGGYDFVLRTEGFEDRSWHVELSAGEKNVIGLPMAITDPDDPVARLRFVAATGVRPRAYDVPRTERSEAETPALVFTLPRGNVRLKDLDQLAFELGSTFDPAAEGLKLEIRRGETVLWTSKGVFDSKSSIGTLPFPEDVRSQLHVGDDVTWGLWSHRRPSGGLKTAHVLATFHVVDVDPAPALTALRDQLAGLSDDVVGEAEVNKLWALGLPMEALKRADSLARAHPKSLAMQLLARSAYKELDLLKCARVRELDASIAADFPDSRRAKFQDAELHAPATSSATAPAGR
jgi:serine/threonine protein kinase